MRKCGETLDLICASVAEVYMQRTGKSAEAIRSIMDAETWMGAQECVDQGFATAIAAEDGDPDAMALARSFKRLAKLKNLPDSLRLPRDAPGVESNNLSLYEARLRLLRT
jgi:ATP-dependent Clp protease protease subunit